MSNSLDTYLDPTYKRYDRYVRGIRKPYIVGHFSIDGNREYIPDNSNCKYLKLPSFNEPIHFDLNQGYDRVQRKPESSHDEKLDHILKFILLNLKSLVDFSKEKFLNFNVICFRGKLRMLMCTPYEFRVNWSLRVSKFKGNIYICSFETEEEKLKRQNESEQQKKISSYGFKFEQYLMSDSPRAKPNTEVPVNESEQFCCMYSTVVHKTSILFGAEMDGIESDVKVDLSNANINDVKFTEVKVCLKPINPRQLANFHRFKTRNWWAQSYLTNVKRIVVGLRNENGIVNEMQSVDVQSMPDKYRMYWSDTVCIKFLDTFLQMIQHKMNGIDCPHTVYKFDYEPQVNQTIRYTIHKGVNEFSFLPDWYTNVINENTLKK